jgi:hypothetical protein
VLLLLLLLMWACMAAGHVKAVALQLQVMEIVYKQRMSTSLWPAGLETGKMDFDLLLLLLCVYLVCGGCDERPNECDFHFVAGKHATGRVFQHWGPRFCCKR